MSFFVVERSSADSSLRIPLPGEFPTREAAIAALSASAAAGEVVLSGEVFIADLSVAIPVLVMQAAAPVTHPAIEAGVSEDVIETSETEPAEEAAESEGALSGESEGLTAEPESWGDLGEAPDSLADALKRAATTLEDEGIVAPDSVPSDHTVILGGEDVTDVASAAEELLEIEEPAEAVEESATEEAVELDVEAVEEAEPSDEAAAAPAEDAAWPWANVESYEIPKELVEQVEESGDTDSLITSAPAAGEEAYLPKPLILGDYADSFGSAEETEAVSEEAPPVAEPVESAGASVEEIVAGPDAEVSAASEVTAGGSSLDLEVAAIVESLSDSEDDVIDLDEIVVAEPGYEVTGELDLAGYTCQDCVYANTCPKVGEASPADCGAFQWRAQ